MKNILLAVSGLNPQIITETLYALLMEGRKVDSIHIITSRLGRDHILKLLQPKGPLDAFLEEYGLTREEIDFNYANIHVPKDSEGRELEEILNAQDNELFLRTCLELTHRFTSNPDTALFFLVAGGRKTMSSCLTLAAQLYGRPQDRIFHILVSPEYESSQEFWFPHKRSVRIELKDSNGNPFWRETKHAEINLISIPFVSIREYISPELLKEPQPPAELMASLVKDDLPMLHIKLSEGKIIYGKIELDMHPARLALFAYFASRKKNCTREGRCTGCYECFVNTREVLNDQDALTQLYKKIPRSRVVEEMSNTGITSLTKENFNSYKSKVKSDIELKLGIAVSKEISITSIGKAPDTKYGLNIDKDRIRIEY